jgi:thymidylate synthase
VWASFAWTAPAAGAMIAVAAYIAHQTGLQFARLNCYIGDPHIGDVNKRDLADLAKVIDQRLAALQGTQ